MMMTIVSLCCRTVTPPGFAGPPPKPMPSVRFLKIPLGERNFLLGCSRSTGCSDSGHDSSSDSRSDSVEEQGSSENGGSIRGISSIEIMNKLKRYGVAGILAYGLLNTAYYLTTFLIVWLYVAPAPGRMGFLAAAERFFKIMAMVWAGSQVTKLIRAAGALAVAPFMERLLSWVGTRFGFRSQGKAFGVIAGICLGVSVTTFFVVTVLWA